MGTARCTAAIKRGKTASGLHHISRDGWYRIIATMQEVLARPSESDKPVNEQEYWVLEIVDRTGSWRPGFADQQSRGFWSEIDRQFMFGEIETELCPLLIDAEER